MYISVCMYLFESVLAMNPKVTCEIIRSSNTRPVLKGKASELYPPEASLCKHDISYNTMI